MASTTVAATPAPAVWKTGRALFVAQGASGALGVVAWLIAARTHPASQVGTALGLVGALTWAGLVGNLGLGSLVVGLLPSLRRLERPVVAGAALATASAAGAGLGLLLAALLQLTSGSLAAAAGRPTVILALVLGGGAWAGGVVLDHLSVAVGRPGLAVGRAIASGVGRLLLLAGGLLLGVRSAEALVAGWSVAIVLGSTLAAVVLWGRGALRWAGSSSRAVAGPLARRAMSTHYPINVLGQSPPMLLPIILASRADPVQAAAFGAAWQLASIVGLLSPAVATGIFAAGAADRATARRITVTARAQVLATVTVGAVALVVAAPTLLAAIGAEYEVGAGALRLLAVALVFDAFTNVEVAHLRVAGRFARATSLNGLIAATAIIGAFAWSPAWGAVGAAFAWLLAQALGTVAATRAAHQHIDTQRGDLREGLARPRLAAAGAGERGGAVDPPVGLRPAGDRDGGRDAVRDRPRSDGRSDVRVGPWPGSSAAPLDRDGAA
jgi:O-antigen/teichoic acid export membrane protein